jgi:hypothetical protein
MKERKCKLISTSKIGFVCKGRSSKLEAMRETETKGGVKLSLYTMPERASADNMCLS